MENHPEIQTVVSEFLSQVIISQPENIYKFGAEYFKSLAVAKRDSDDASVLVVMGPSGVGKGTLLKKLFAAFPDKFGLSISHTTRPPREGEEDGVQYFFVSKEEFEKRIEQADYFIEYAQVHSNFYGTSFKGVDQISAVQKKICVLEIDVQGAQKILQSGKLAAKPRLLYIAPPTLEILEERLRGRATETEDSIKTRLENAKLEMAWLEQPGNYNKKIVNDALESAFTELKQTILDWYPELA